MTSAERLRHHVRAMYTRCATSRARVAFWLSLLGLLSATRADAQAAPDTGNLSGTWRAGATAIDVKVESWGKSCGGEPQSSNSSGGGTVQLEHSGNRLTLRAPGRAVHSDACFSQNPALRRTSTQAQDGTWVTRCSTKQDDPRAEEGTYTLKLLGPDRLLYQDVSRFRWRLNDSFCVATITTVQTLTRDAPGSAPAPQAVIKPSAPAKAERTGRTSQSTAARAPAPPALPAALGGPSTKPGCVPGPAAELRLAPARVRVQLGERRCLRARVVDAQSCALEDAKVSFSLDASPGRSATLDAQGCFTANANAAEGEGTFRVIAQSDGLRDEARVEVVAADLSGLVAKRLGEDAGLVAVEPEPVAAETAPPASSQTATRAVDTPRAASGLDRRMLALLLGAAALAALCAIVFARRARASIVPAQSAASDASQAVPRPAREQGKPASERERTMICPACGTRFPAGSAFCGKDGKALIAADT